MWETSAKYWDTEIHSQMLLIWHTPKDKKDHSDCSRQQWCAVASSPPHVCVPPSFPGLSLHLSPRKWKTTFCIWLRKKMLQCVTERKECWRMLQCRNVTMILCLFACLKVCFQGERDKITAETEKCQITRFKVIFTI